MTTIAVIDDDASFLAYMRDALSQGGWSVATCSESLAAPGFLRERIPDLVILDVCMDTRESGWEICSFLQLHPATHHIPIIICSAATDIVQLKSEWLREHDIAVLDKPFDLEDMYAMVRAAIARSRPDRNTYSTGSSA